MRSGELRDPEDESIYILQCNKTYFGGGVFLASSSSLLFMVGVWCNVF